MEQIITMNAITKAESIIANGTRRVKVRYNDGTYSVLRIFKSTTGNICEFKKGSNRTGWHLNFQNIVDINPIIPKKTQADKWKDAWEKVVSRLEKSGLWENVLPNIKLALNMGYDRVKKAADDYWHITYGSDRDVKIKAYLEKYPELSKENDNKELYVNTEVIWFCGSSPKVKKMRFCKYNNEFYLQAIQKAMLNKSKHSASGRFHYDISFEYNPETNRAWYSEEYKGCGNGHYYLALDATHAIYYEKD